MSGDVCDDCCDAEREIERLRDYILAHCPNARELLGMHQAFSGRMLDKLLDKLLEGCSGWNEIENREELIDKLKQHVRRATEEGEVEQWVDVANLAALLDAMGKR